MKTYIQITGGRGPVECARAVALVIKKLTAQFPQLKLVDYEPHNSQPGCLMSATLSVETDDAKVVEMKSEWEGSVLWISTKNPYRPYHNSFNMRDGLAICEGKSNADWNCSAPHGAGRLLSRNKAKESITMDNFRAAMAGICTTSVCESTLDESPMAYKDAQEIIRDIEPTCKILYFMRPVVNLKDVTP